MAGYSVDQVVWVRGTVSEVDEGDADQPVRVLCHGDYLWPEAQDVRPGCRAGAGLDYCRGFVDGYDAASGTTVLPLADSDDYRAGFATGYREARDAATDAAPAELGIA